MNIYEIYFLPTYFLDALLNVIRNCERSEIIGFRLKTFLTAAAEKTSEYSNVFKNLMAEEIKTFETYDKDEKMKNLLTFAIVLSAFS